MAVSPNLSFKTLFGKPMDDITAFSPGFSVVCGVIIQTTNTDTKHLFTFLKICTVPPDKYNLLKKSGLVSTWCLISVCYMSINQICAD